ncbi:MAG: polyprenyl synthetase family protein [SAR86 cluster bacterium]|uniref:Polyprenyl synthetase family protein n=1 Tax=SAR86 cluster bacterium TaxID=2030880 RepID=A0A937HWS1_9GAMM|nr:polyprenyl synthetase family protein [SAR86 cluster bacterium]
MTNNLETLDLKDLPFLKKNLKRIDKAILQSLPPKNLSKISRAIHYSVLNGGKRIRPQLVLLMAETLEVDVSQKTIDLMAASGELIHCYSLIHDDLPSMDDDDFRRGKLSCHKKFDEATAILAGDAIQPLALEVLTTINDKKLKSEQKLKIINLFAKACGPKGMVEGQSRDIDAEGKNIKIDVLDEIHYLKTGKLIEACVESICFLKNDLPKKHLRAFLDFAKKFGLAFQIKDDILDVLGDEKKIGKPINSDSKHNKATYPSIIGLEASQLRAEKLCSEALKILNKLPYNTDNLIKLSKFIILRNK